MDARFSAHNSHLEGDSSFELLDPNLRRLGKVPLVYRSPLLDSLPRQSGIYTITGGRQVGKTTLLKQWMQYLLADGIPPAAIIYLSGELKQIMKYSDGQVWTRSRGAGPCSAARCPVFPGKYAQ